MTFEGTVSDRPKLHPMGDVERAPPTLSLDRLRAIALHWEAFAATDTVKNRSLTRAAEADKDGGNRIPFKTALLDPAG